MWRKCRHGTSTRTNALMLGLGDLIGGYLPSLGDAVEHAVARSPCHRGRAVGPAQFRRLRQRDQKGCFGKRKLLRFLTEIGERSGTNALKIAAVRRQRHIKPEHLVLVQAPLKFDSADDLAKFGAERAVGTG